MSKENDDIPAFVRRKLVAASPFELECWNCGKKEDHTYCFPMFYSKFLYKICGKYVKRYERLYGKGE